MMSTRKAVGRAVVGLLALTLPACAGQQERPAPEYATQEAAQAPEWVGYTPSGCAR